MLGRWETTERVPRWGMMPCECRMVREIAMLRTDWSRGKVGKRNASDGCGHSRIVVIMWPELGK